ncbi:unnamed protein product [Trifolium pratense]|uniref:Uncharacterized protein n=1 Tax=Trifolium pratense TaxID=57577 RepID=A0ACB0JZM1_TRIPR|nr:unnamed protein product [Trifolium pratense]
MVKATTLLHKAMEYETTTNGGILSEETKASTSVNIYMRRLLRVIQTQFQFAPIHVKDLD